MLALKYKISIICMTFSDRLLVQVGFFAFLDFLIPSPIFLHLILAVLMASLSKTGSSDSVTIKGASIVLESTEHFTKLPSMENPQKEDHSVTDEKIEMKRELLSNETLLPAPEEKTKSEQTETGNQKDIETPTVASNSEDSLLKDDDLEEESVITGMTESQDSSLKGNTQIQKDAEHQSVKPEEVHVPEDITGPVETTSNIEKTVHVQNSTPDVILEAEEPNGTDSTEVEKIAAPPETAPKSVTEEETKSNGSLSQVQPQSSQDAETVSSNDNHHTSKHADGNSSLTNGDSTHTNGNTTMDGQLDDSTGFTPANPKLPSNPMYQPDNDPGPTRFAYQTHPRTEEVVAETNAYFLGNWPFRKEAEKKQFVLEDANRWACMAFSMALDDRIVSACKVNTLLFLLDGMYANL